MAGKRNKPKKLLLLSALLAAAAAVFCHASLETEDWVVSSHRIPSAFDGFRITLLTDLHGREHRQLVEAVEKSRPDLLAISGDLADERTDFADIEPVLRQLTAIAPTVFVTGNHEWVRDDTEALLQQIAACGVTVLRNDFFPLERDGQTIVIAGADDPNGYADMLTPEQLMERIRRDGDPYVVMLYHRNDAIDLWSGLQTDLVLSGHGHGGVIRLPFVGGLLGVDRRFFPKNAEGLYREGRTTLAVSRGIGGARLWNPPHLPTIVLRAEP